MAPQFQPHDSSPLPTSTQHGYHTRASTGIAQKEVLYSAKYHPMDDITRPTKALRHKTRYANKAKAQMQHDTDDSGQSEDTTSSGIADSASSSGSGTTRAIDEPSPSIERSSIGYSLRKRPTIAPNYKKSWHPQDQELDINCGRSTKPKLGSPHRRMGRGKNCGPMSEGSGGEHVSQSKSTRRLSHILISDDPEFLGNGNIETAQQISDDEEPTDLHDCGSMYPARSRFKDRLVIPDSEGEDDCDIASEYMDVQGDDIGAPHSTLQDRTTNDHSEAQWTNADEVGDAGRIGTEGPTSTSDRPVDSMNQPSQNVDRPGTTPIRRNEQVFARESREVVLNDDTRTNEHSHPQCSSVCAAIDEEVSGMSPYTEGSDNREPSREHIRLRATALQALKEQSNVEEDETSRTPESLFPTQLQKNLSTPNSATEDNAAYNATAATSTQADTLRDTRSGDLAQAQEPTEYEVPLSRQIRYVEPFEVFEFPKGRSFFKHLKNSMFEGNMDDFEAYRDESDKHIEENVSVAGHEVGEAHNSEDNILSDMPEGEELGSSTTDNDSHSDDQIEREEIQDNQCCAPSEFRRQLKRRWDAREISPEALFVRRQREKRQGERVKKSCDDLLRKNFRRKSRDSPLDIVIHEESKRRQFMASLQTLTVPAPIYNDYDQENVGFGLDGQAPEPPQRDLTNHVSVNAESGSSTKNERQMPTIAFQPQHQTGLDGQEQFLPTTPSLFGPFPTEANVPLPVFSASRFTGPNVRCMEQANVAPVAVFDRIRLNGHGLR
ncbi:MAG: hypothetical protein Q9165_006163 [Trypethelium subeluteriae]